MVDTVYDTLAPARATPARRSIGEQDLPSYSIIVTTAAY
jgi:hypothetical protein